MFPVTDPVLVFTILVFTILISPLIGQRLHIPDLVLLLVVGALLGPNGFGIVARNSAVTLFGSVGLLYIMFLSGLETDVHRFSKTGRPSLIFGLLTFLVPQIFGTLIGKYVLTFDWPTSILLASMFASHTLLAYPMAVRLGISRAEPVTISVGATIITNILSLLVLAIIAELNRGASVGFAFWITIGLGLSGLVAFTWIGIPYLTRWFLKNVTEEGEAQFLFVLFIFCGSAYLSHYAKMEPIIGAFLAGTAFSRLIPEHSALMNRVNFTGNSIFIPFFLISVGMLIDARALLQSPRSIFVAIVMVLTVILTKYIAAAVAARLFKYNTGATNVMFGLSVAQAAATLAAVLIGYELKIFDDTVLNGAIAMIMVTCPLGVWMVERNGRKLIDSNSTSKQETVITEQRMLVPVVNPASASRILDLAFMLRAKNQPGAIFPITIVPDSNDITKDVKDGEKLLANCLTHSASVNIPVEPSVRIDMNPADGIIRAVKELRINSVLTGWSGAHSASTMLFGSISQRLVNNCPSRLYFCHLVRPLSTTRKILLFLSPLTENREDFSIFLKEMKILSHQSGSEIHVYAIEKNSQRLQKKIELLQPARPLFIHFSETLTNVRNQLFSDIGEDDLVVLPGERISSNLWTPTMVHVSELLISRYPQNNLLLCYSPLPLNTDTFESGFHMSTTLPFSLNSFEIDREIGFNDTLQLMVRSVFSSRTDFTDQIWKLLCVSADTYPVGLTASAVLLHAHCESLEKPILIVCRGYSDWQLPKLNAPVRIILSMLSPKNDPPEQHLQRLAWIGRKFNDENFIHRVSTANTSGEICTMIQGE